MESPGKIPSLRPIARHRWAIPLPSLKGLAYADYPVLAKNDRLDYAQACQELEQLGFQKVYSTHSVSHSRLKYLREDEPSEASEYTLWHHPVGVVATTRSYNSSLPLDGTNRNAIPTLIMDHLDLHYELDSGAGSEVAHIAGVKVSSSGTSTLQFDGTNRKMGSASCVRGSNSVISFLESCQKYGRLVPVDRWSIGAHFIYISDEMLLPVSAADAQEWRSRDISAEIKEDPSLLEEGKKRLLAACGPSLAPVVETSWEPRPRTEPNQDRPKEDTYHSEWMSVEYAHKQVGEALFLTGQRFPSSAVRAHVQHWMEVAKGWHGENMADWRVDEPGPAGLSLPTVLLFTMSQPSHARLLRMIEESPVETVRQWTTKPDGAGYTLGQRLLTRAFVGSALESPNEIEQRLDAVFEALVKRVGVEEIRMGTPLRSPLGVWLEQLSDRTEFERDRMAPREALASRMLMKMAMAGVEWKAPLNWRTYPNVFQSDDKTPRFKTLGPEPPRPEEWEKLMGVGAAGVSLARQLAAWDLENRLPAPSVSRRRLGRF